MHLGDFSLEILVNNKVLTEYQIPNDDNVLVPFSRVAIDKRESEIKECKTTTYVAVPETSCHFAIRVGIHSTNDPNILKGVHFIDGKNDNTYMELNPLSSNGPYNYSYGFYNFNKTIFHLFKFDKNGSSSSSLKDDKKGGNDNNNDNNIDNNTFISNLPKCIPSKATKDKGSLGVISVYFYKAERLPEKRSSTKKYTIKNYCYRHHQQKDFNNLEISLDDLNFNPSDLIFIKNPKEEVPCLNLKTTHTFPIAVLHIHYQTKDWIKNFFKFKGLPIPKSLSTTNNNDSPSSSLFIVKKNEKKINNNNIITKVNDLWYGELTDVESESESEYSSSSNSNDEQIKHFTSSSNRDTLNEKKVVANAFKIKKRKIIISSSDDNSSEADENFILNDTKDNSQNSKRIMVNNKNLNIKTKVDNKNCNHLPTFTKQYLDNKKVKVNRNDKNKHKNFNKKDQVDDGKNLYNSDNKKLSKIDKIDGKNIKVNKKSIKTYKNLYDKAKNKGFEVENNVSSKNFSNINNNKDINIKIDSIKFNSMCFDDKNENISKEENIIIIDDNDERMTTNDELMFISKVEFEGKKIKEIIDLTID